MYKGYLIDLDGVAYLGKKVIPTCRDFIKRLNERNIKYCFVTNNSSRTNLEVCAHLNSLGYEIEVENIITSSEVTANYIRREKKDAKVYLIGMNGIRTELLRNEINIVSSNSDYVVIGIDFDLTYEKLENACREVFNGAKLISTNSDIHLSKEDFIIPGNGSITQVVSVVTNVSPLYMGKPQTEMLEYGLEKLNLAKSDVAIIGDNYNTDILGGINFGIDSIFVETGVMKREDLFQFEQKPTIIVKDLSLLK